MAAEQAPVAMTAKQLAAALDAELLGDGGLLITGTAGIEAAGPGDLTFIRDARRAAAWTGSSAGAAVVSKGIDVPGGPGSGRAILIVQDADRAILQVLRVAAPPHEEPAVGVHAAASIDQTATLGKGVAVGPGAVVGRGAVIGANTVLHAGAVVGARVTIGQGCDIRARAVVEDRCKIGGGVILHPGVVIGADGFGYVPSADGKGLEKIPHAGNVVLEDGVEIGANSTIDRGKFGETRIGQGTKVDNLVQIGHNCTVGRACILCGTSCLAGSVTLGDGVVIGGGAGVADGVTVGPGAKVGGGAGVIRNVPAGEVWAGYPAAPRRDTVAGWAATRRLPAILRDLKQQRNTQENR